MTFPLISDTTTPFLSWSPMTYKVSPTTPTIRFPSAHALCEPAQKIHAAKTRHLSEFMLRSFCCWLDLKMGVHLSGYAAWQTN